MSEELAAQVRVVEVGVEEAGQRIDNFLLRLLKGVPKSRIYRILRKGEVRINKKRAKPDYKLQAGDQVRIPPVRLSGERKQATPPPTLLAELQSRILLEDEDFIILDKPPGLAVHGGSGLEFGLIEALRVLREHAPFLELAHRLDRDTSGCLVIAKRRAALTAFHGCLRAGGVQKQYLTLVQGRWRGEARQVSQALAKGGAGGGGQKVAVTSEGKTAHSHFKPLKRFAQASLMAVSIETGRTHQIRVHAAHEGHPVAGDTKYGDFAFNRHLKTLGLKRLFLHAARLKFQMPASGMKYDIRSALPADLEQVLEKIEHDEAL